MIHLVLLLAFFNAATSNSIADSNADLTAKLMEEIVSDGSGENLIFSPASLMYGIAMLYEGMDDRSRRVVNNALNFPSDVNDFRRQFAVSFILLHSEMLQQCFKRTQKVSFLQQFASEASYLNLQSEKSLNSRNSSNSPDLQSS